MHISRRIGIPVAAAVVVASVIVFSLVFAGSGWLTLKPGMERGKFSYLSDGTLLYNQIKFPIKILVSDESGAHKIPAKEIYISPLSPNERYAFLQAKALDFTPCWLLDMRNFQVTDANPTHYGPARWVNWCPNGPYGLLYDPEAGTLIRVDLETGQANDIPMVDLPWLHGLENISNENMADFLEAHNEYAQANLKTIMWIPGTCVFRVAVDVKPFNKGSTHSYNVEVDLQQNRARELP